jgi:abortive infection bacteriophage resistance protein
MSNDGIEELVEEAHSYFSEISVHEVIDINRDAATKYMNDYYGYHHSENIDKYLDVVNKLRQICSPDC